MCKFGERDIPPNSSDLVKSDNGTIFDQRSYITETREISWCTFQQNQMSELNLWILLSIGEKVAILCENVHFLFLFCYKKCKKVSCINAMTGNIYLTLQKSQESQISKVQGVSK